MPSASLTSFLWRVPIQIPCVPKDFWIYERNFPAVAITAMVQLAPECPYAKFKDLMHNKLAEVQRERIKYLQEKITAVQMYLGELESQMAGLKDDGAAKQVGPCEDQPGALTKDDESPSKRAKVGAKDDEAC